MDDAFLLTMPLWEIALRASLIYLALVFLVRVVPKRRVGNISPNDILSLIVIGGLGADAIAGGSTSMADILLMIGLIVAWGYVLDTLEYRFAFVRRLMRHRQTALVQDGRLLRENLHHELITEEELMAVLRRHDAPELSMVRSACLEADGEISVIKRAEPGQARRQDG
jgi:uncharacterized membrane protein YcaP (DUF421 family)